MLPIITSIGYRKTTESPIENTSAGEEWGWVNEWFENLNKYLYIILKFSYPKKFQRSHEYLKG